MLKYDEKKSNKTCELMFYSCNKKPVINNPQTSQWGNNAAKTC